MEILDLRHFSSSDVRSLLEQETETWSDLLSWDYGSSADMILRYIDAKILPGYAAIDRGAVFGYTFFVYEGPKGVIGDLYVDANSRIQREYGETGVEQRLIRHVIETLQQSPGIKRVEAQLLPHRSGAVAKPFIESGFQRHPRLFMVLPLEASDATEPMSASTEIEIRRWAEQDYQDVASVITMAYRSHVDATINDQYRSVTGSLRFLNNIVRFPGCGIFDQNASYVAVHRPTRTLVGAILCSRVREDVGHVTQVCVVPEYRGHAIGKALLSATAQELIRRKFSALSLTVTESNSGAVELYRRLGYETKHIFDAFVWEQPAGAK